MFALLLALVTVNVVFSTLLWIRVSDLADGNVPAATTPSGEREPVAAKSDRDRDDRRDGETTARKETTEERSPRSTATPIAGTVDPSKARPEPSVAKAPPTKIETPRAEPSRASKPKANRAEVERPRAERLPPSSAVVTLARPKDFDGLRAWTLSQRPPATANHRDAALIATATWGSGRTRKRALDALAVSGRWGSLLNAVDALPREDAAAGRDLSVPAAPAALSALAGEWERLWSELAVAGEGAREGSWAGASRIGLGKPTDLLILVDLSVSMAPEVEESIRTLREMVPLTSGLGWTFGWVGYRDEVVDTLPLTADPDAFLASLERWQCEGGGDVPEGLDLALDEAFRFRAFTWRKGVEHRIVVLGDAPPPYERIAPMVSLAESGRRSPEKFRIGTIAIVREDEYAGVPGFSELATAGEGLARRVENSAELPAAWWEQLIGSRTPLWSNRPLASR